MIGIKGSEFGAQGSATLEKQPTPEHQAAVWCSSPRVKFDQAFKGQNSVLVIKG